MRENGALAGGIGRRHT